MCIPRNLALRLVFDSARHGVKRKSPSIYAQHRQKLTTGTIGHEAARHEAARSRCCILIHDCVQQSGWGQTANSTCESLSVPISDLLDDLDDVLIHEHVRFAHLLRVELDALAPDPAVFEVIDQLPMNLFAEDLNLRGVKDRSG